MEQAAADLEKNHQRQRELTEELRMLKQEEALLTDILSLTERYEAPADRTPPAERRRDEAPAPATPAPAARAKKAGAKKAGAKGTSHRPLLGDLLTELLVRHDEPCPAKELRDELMATHPKRHPTPQVVRNTLESLVAKGRVRRHKQRRSVMYTLVRPGSAGSDQAGSDQAG
ncbi:hypothetical protein ACFRMQ_29895 [Kitasatospora sp. NPDC056783]|uniref:hypothetical protein n=1 Tax=Kitasatospora sp. NPDC056783 TaxID=3345943 RepID=UPI0036A8CFCD